MKKKFSEGVVHKLPTDLKEKLKQSQVMAETWEDITPLARNEFICWIEDAKKQETRAKRIERAKQELEEGKRRPCCWPGCKHRSTKNTNVNI